MEHSAFKVCPFCKQQIRREAIKCRFCGEWLESSEADPARTLTTDKPVVPPPPPSPPKGHLPGSMTAIGRALDEAHPQQRSAKPPPIPDIQNQTTSKARAKTGGKKAKTRVIIAIAATILAVFVIGTAIVNDQRRSNSSTSNAATVDPQYEAAAESYLQNLGMEEFTSKEFAFSLMMPKERSTANMDLGMTFIGQVNGHSITVIAKDLPPSDPLYNVDSVSALRAQLVIGLSRNKNISDVQSPRNVKDKNGHLGTEIMYTLTYGSTRYHEESHAFQVGHRMCVVQIAAPEAQWNKQLADSVLTTFAMQ